jgi:hypothetical protein
MTTRAIDRKRSRITIVGVLTLLMVGWLGGQAMATWDLPDDSYTAGFWDGADEDALLSLVWDHASGTLPGAALLATFEVARPTAASALPSVDSAFSASFHCRAPPLAGLADFLVS